MADTLIRHEVTGGVGASAVRPDGVPKLTGNFAFVSDLYDDRMLWGAVRRSQHAHARILRIDVAPALARTGVRAVLTQDDVAGRPAFGFSTADQPVLAHDTVQYCGEPIAVVAADDPETARLAAAAIEVDFEVLVPLADPERAEREGSILTRRPIRRGDPDARGEVAVEGYYEVGQQDQAPLGTEAGLAIPDGAGGVDLWATTQAIHADRDQVSACLGLPPERVRCHPVGMGGAFGAREDMSLHIHLCMLALRTGRPVKMVVNRAESFVSHVHRHPARMWYRHEADRAGNLVRVDARILMDAGPYMSTSYAVVANAACFAVGPYRVDNVSIDAVGVRTNNPISGAMRGFGSVQVCVAHEAQMDRLAAQLGMDPVEIRLRNSLEHGGALPTTGQPIEGSLPTSEVINALASIPLPDPRSDDGPSELPGGSGLTTDPEHVRRGVGWAISIKDLGFGNGSNDYADARLVLSEAGMEIHTAAIEVGQGLVTVCQQIAREATGIERVVVLPVDTSQIGSAGFTSASRQTQMTGGAVLQAADALRSDVLERFDGDDLSGAGVWRNGELLASLAEVCAAGPIVHEARYTQSRTEALDENGQGSCYADLAVAAHRAVVDVDPELGLVRIVRIDTAQDVGRVINPVAIRGQIEGGILQGAGLAIMEELVVEDGRILNASFTDYLLPTILDAPAVEYRLIEEPSHWGPLGAKGAGEPPTISSTPAVVAAIRDATGRDLNRVPVRPADIVGR